MTENEIMDSVEKLFGNVKVEDSAQTEILIHAAKLLSQFLIDIRTIAESLQTIAEKDNYDV